MNTRTELFPDAELQRLEKKRKRSLTASALIGGLALLCCVLLCALTNTANAVRLAFCAIAVSTLAGWAVISLLVFSAAEAKHELRHARMLREGPEERLCGALSLDRDTMRIRGSIRFRFGRLRGEEGERRVKVCASRAALLPQGRDVTLFLVNGYIAAFEDV